MYPIRRNGKVVGLRPRRTAKTDAAPLAADDPDVVEFELDRAKEAKVAETRAELVRRAVEAADFITGEDTLRLLVALWPGLDTAALGPEFTVLRNLYQHFTTRRGQIRAAADIDAVNNYDPVTDNGWPA